jgi:hypothetical protein
MDCAIAGARADVAAQAWRRAYITALEHPGWSGLVTVATAALRLGGSPLFDKSAEAWARETYWTAMFRAHRQGSLEGVLTAARAFGDLGDHEMVVQSLHVAEGLAALGGHADDVARVRTQAARLLGRMPRSRANVG